MGQYFKDNSQAFGGMINIGSGMFNAMNQLSQGAAEQQYYDYLANAEQQRINQQTINIQNAASMQMGVVQSQSKSFANSQRAAMANSGLSGGEELLDDTAYKAKLDEMAILQNANSQIAGLDNQSETLRQTGMNARKSANTKAATSLIGTANSVSDYWYKMSKTSAGKAAASKTTSKGGAE